MSKTPRDTNHQLFLYIIFVQITENSSSERVHQLRARKKRDLILKYMSFILNDCFCTHIDNRYFVGSNHYKLMNHEQMKDKSRPLCLLIKCPHVRVHEFSYIHSEVRNSFSEMQMI